ncbi:hypothetical protein BX666DRAFT_2019198 [Dichotomocladium elegans]|nr:hypothetical protein BX666DRAFT_2019198 [Dichotomocladium elegans]
MVEIFDVQRPGKESTKIPTVPKRKSKEGLKGIISCLDFSTDGLYALGSYSQSVGIYDETNHELCLKLGGFKSGVTQVRFTPDGQHLFTASRTSDAIQCWDIRNTCDVLYDLPRQGRTSQRLTFDLDPSGNVLVAGDHDGNILFYDISASATENRLLRSFKGHHDTSSCTTFNPTYPWLLASCSGQRKFDHHYNSESDDENDIPAIDNSLSIWHMPGQTSWFAMET